MKEVVQPGACMCVIANGLYQGLSVYLEFESNPSLLETWHVL